MISSRFAPCLMLALAACGLSESDTTRIAVAEANPLGVTSIEITRFEESGAHVFELRGLDASEHDVALVRQRIGRIDDLDRYLPGDGLIGAEHTFSADQDYRLVSREVRSFTFATFTGAPALQGFLEMPSVASALEGAHIRVAPAPAVATERGYYSYLVYGDSASCPASQLNTTPVANQCCQTDASIYDSDNGSYEFHFQSFKAASGQNAGLMIQKNRSPDGFGSCVSQTGGACSGSACYYGPNGFARPNVFTGTSGYTISATTVYNVPDQPFYFCIYRSQGDTPDYWPAVTGTFPTNAGCPGGATGAGEWDY